MISRSLFSLRTKFLSARKYTDTCIRCVNLIRKQSLLIVGVFANVTVHTVRVLYVLRFLLNGAEKIRESETRHLIISTNARSVSTVDTSGRNILKMYVYLKSRVERSVKIP